jgi:succinate-semialdehyde dehydrogenase/glutarate-semialdehyde dehydrogenase
MINDHLMSHGPAETPWGGPGYSGLGRTNGGPGFREMQQVQVIVDDTLPGIKNLPAVLRIFFRYWERPKQ